MKRKNQETPKRYEAELKEVRRQKNVETVWKRERIKKTISVLPHWLKMLPSTTSTTDYTGNILLIFF